MEETKKETIEEKYKVVNTYSRIWFWRIMAIGICYYFYISAQPHRFLDLHDKQVSWYVDTFAFEDMFFEHLFQALHLVFLGCIVLYGGSFLLTLLRQKAGAILDIGTDILAIVTETVAIFFTGYCMRSYVRISYDGILDEVLAPKMFLILVLVGCLYVHVITYWKNRDKFSQDKAVLNITASLCLIGVFIAGLVVVSPCMKLYNQFKINYGTYEKEKHAPRTELENHLSNYRQGAIDVDDKLYFIDSTTDTVMQVDSDGNLSSWGDDLKIPDTFLAYDNGYLYYVRLEQGIFRANVDTRTEELVYAAENLKQQLAVRDGYLYYVELTHGFGEKSENRENICRIKLEEKMDFSKSEAYIGNLSVGRKFYFDFIYDDKDYTFHADLQYGSSRYTNAFPVKKDGYYYGFIPTEDRRESIPYMDLPTLVKYKDGLKYIEGHATEEKQVIVEKCTAFAVYGEFLFYAAASDRGTEIYQMPCDDTSDAKLLTTLNENKVMYILVTDGKIVVAYLGDDGYEYEVVSYQ